MSYRTGLDNKIQYDEFFQDVADQLLKGLPGQLRHIKIIPQPGKNWLVLKYPDFKYSQYELHLSQRSKHHANYFGEEPIDVVDFYFGNDYPKRLAWLDAMQPFLDVISQQVGKRVVLGEWGENWAWLAMAINRNITADRDPKVYSLATSQFIQATYIPIKKAFDDVF